MAQPWQWISGFFEQSVCGCRQMHLDYLLGFICLIVIDQRGKKILSSFVGNTK